MEYELLSVRMDYRRVRVRASAKRHMPHLRRRWVVEASRPDLRFVGGPGGQAVIQERYLTITCETHADAMKVARAVALRRPVDLDLVVAMSRGWRR